MREKQTTAIVHYDYVSIVIFILTIMVFLSIIILLCFAGILGMVFSIILFLKFVRIFNHVIYINNFFFNLSFLYLERIKIDNIVKMTCQNAGLGSSRDTIISIYYIKKGNIKETKLLYFNIFNKHKLIKLLNSLYGKINIDSSSFVQIGITMKEEVFMEI